MIRYVSGDLIRSAAYGHRFDAIAHGVNCQGVMGSGIAKTIRDQMPIVYRRYLEFHEEGRLKLGSVQAVPVRGYEGRGGWGLVVWNCATQENYGRKGGPYADLNAVRQCLVKVRDQSAQNPTLVPRPGNHEASKWEPVQLGIPMIGAGLGGLTGEEVKGVFEDVFKESELVHATVFDDFQPGMICGPWRDKEAV